jgi:inner membrane protein
MLTNVITDHAAWICALFGMACYAAWSVFRTRSMMLLIQLGALIGFSLHYALLGVATAAAVNALGAVQIAASLLLGTRPSLRWVGYALAAVMVAASVFTWQASYRLLP